MTDQELELERLGSGIRYLNEQIRGHMAELMALEVDLLRREKILKDLESKFIGVSSEELLSLHGVGPAIMKLVMKFLMKKRIPSADESLRKTSHRSRPRR